MHALSKLTIVLATFAILGQSSPVLPPSDAGAPKFEMASIKPTTKLGSGPMNSLASELIKNGARQCSGGLFRIPEAPLNLLVQLAYNVKDFQVVGGPSWANSDRYEIIAKAEGNAGFQQMQPMLQSLLADRFKLTFHRESKERWIYELVVDRRGLKIEAAKAGSCVTLSNNPPPFAPGNHPKFCGGIWKMLRADPEPKIRMEGIEISMPKLIELLSDQVGRTVLDKTGYIEKFDFHLEYAAAGPFAAFSNSAPPGDPTKAASSGNSSTPSIFDALREQLGLQLKSAKGPVDVLVLDHVSRPGEN